MNEKEEGEDIEDSLTKNTYNEKDIENKTGVKIYKSKDYNSLRDEYLEKFKKGTNKDLSFHKKRIYSMDWLDNNTGSILVTGSSDNSIKVWDMDKVLNSSNKQNYNNTLSPLLSINPHNEPINNISSRNNYENQFLSSFIDKHIKFWDIRTNITNNNNKFTICKPSYDKVLKEETKHLKFNNHGSQFAFMNKEGSTIFIYDFGKFEEIQQINFKPQISDFIFNNNDDTIYATSEDGNVYLVNTKINNSKKICIQGSLFPLDSIDIDKKNEYFITGGNDGILITYSIEDLMSCKTYKRSDQGIRQVIYNYDDKIIASIYDGKNIDFFSTELDEHIYTIFTNNNQHFIKWDKKKNILGYISDEKKNEEIKDKKNESGKINNEGNAHFFILYNS